MLNYTKMICGATSGPEASAAGIFNDIKKNFKEVTGWKENDEGIFICPYDSNAGIEFTMAESTTSTTLSMGVYTREGERYPWTGAANKSVITSCAEGKSPDVVYMTVYTSASGKSFTLGFSTSKDTVPVNVIAGMCSGEMTFIHSNTLLSRGKKMNNTNSSYCYNYSAITGNGFDFYAATAINPILGVQFDEIVKIVSVPYTVNIGQLFKSFGGSYRVIEQNRFGILVQGDH